VDFARDLGEISVDIRLEAVAGRERVTSSNASWRLLAIAEDIPRYTFLAASDQFELNGAPLKAASAAFISSWVKARDC